MDGRVSRRQLLTVVALGGAVLSGCAFGAGDPAEPDPLIRLADAARADVALATALVAADPEFGPRIDPLLAARSDHAAALDAEVARLIGEVAPPTTVTPPPSAPADPTLDGLRAALESAAFSAATTVLDLPADRIGLVASISACCATYAAVLA